MTEILDARLGRLRFPTVFDDLKETLGNSLETVGSRAVPGDPRAKPFALSLPVRREHDQDGGARLRRQVRALMENSEARGQGLYFALSFDPDLDAWLLVGGADLTYDEGGPSFQRFKLTFEDVFVIGRPRTHRPARRLDLSDRRLPGTPRDFLRQIYSADFSTVPLVSMLAVPPGADRLVTSTGRSVTPALRSSEDGDVGLVYGLDHGQAVSFNQDATDFGKADVLIEDMTDPSDPEEVFGPEQGVPTSALQLRNGICRVRYIEARQTFAVDRWNGSAYAERYRFQLASHPGGRMTALGSLRCAEWTPERGVVQVIGENGGARIEAYVTLQRGWREPRIEVYGKMLGGTGTDQEGAIRWAASDSAATYAVMATSQAGAAFFSDDPGASWAGTRLVTFAGAAENWALVYRTDDPDESQVLAVALARGALYGLSDTTMFGGGARDGLRLRGLDTITGYVSVQLEDVAGSIVVEEAEDDIYASGSTSVVGDGDASEGYAVQDDQFPATPVEPEDGEQNFMPNPSSEYDAVGAAPASWEKASHSRITYTYYEVRAANPQSGTKAFYVDARNTGDHHPFRLNMVPKLSDLIPRTAGDEMTIGLKGLVTNPSRDGVGVGIEWLKSDHTQAGINYGEKLPGTGLKTPVVQATAPADTEWAVPFVFAECRSADTSSHFRCYYDAVVIFNGLFDDPFTDPGFNDGDSVGWLWTGTPGDSRSDKALPPVDPPTDTLRRTLTEDLGDYGLWVRVRASSDDVPAYFVAALDGAEVTETFKRDVGTYSWVFMGVIAHATDSEVLSIVSWTDGTGEVLLDRLALVPLLSDDIEGPRGRGGLALTDSRGIPALVRR